MAEKTKPNVKALAEFRKNGKPVPVGTVIAKSDFRRKQDWQNLCHMQPKPRAEETDEKVGAPGKAAADKAAADKAAGGMPNPGGK